MRTPLEKAAQAGDLREVQRLLAAGADPNDKSGVYGSPLNAVATAYNATNGVAIIKALIAAGADPNGRGSDGNVCWVTPLYSAASMGSTENARALLDAGAQLQPGSCSRLIVGWLKAPVIDLLVQRGLDLKAVDENGRNELHVALGPTVVPQLEGIEYLIRYDSIWSDPAQNGRGAP